MPDALSVKRNLQYLQKNNGFCGVQLHTLIKMVTAMYKKQFNVLFYIHVGCQIKQQKAQIKLYYTADLTTFTNNKC